MLPFRFNQMMSLDIVSLFTKVPTDEILAVVQDKTDCRFLAGKMQLHPNR